MKMVFACCFSLQEMYDAFLFWSEHSNRDVRHAGFMALNAFLQQISDMLVQRAPKNQAGDKAVFKVSSYTWFHS